MKTKTRFLAAVLFCGSLLACPGQKADPVKPAPTAKPSSAPAEVKQAAVDFKAMDRSTFNRVAVQMNLALFWVEDSNNNKAIDANEVASLMFYPKPPQWVDKGGFSEAFVTTYKQMTVWANQPPMPADLSAEEKTRRQLVLKDLDQGRPTLVFNDFRSAPDEDKALIQHMRNAAALIDEIFEQQQGLVELKKKIAADDAPSQSLFRRNWGPECVAPKTEGEKACSAIAGSPEPKVGVYPAKLQEEKDFCKTIAKNKDGEKLLSPFVVVQEQKGKLVPVPYTQAYKPQMEAISKELLAAEAGIKDAGEKPFKDYLKAAAQAFVDNNWEPADEAWSKMNAQNSRWYLRIGPDEVYWEPCSRKAGFHLTFARINPDSLNWQTKLKPVQQEMEQTFADLIGAPYKARQVSFHLPDFIDIVINAGDDRGAMGATIGQSLPNWGPVANEGRGRTVAMSNLYTDPDSQDVRRQQSQSLLSAETMQKASSSKEPGLLSTILHEAAHNLGPAHEYKVKNKTDEQIFGGPLASTLEELKAQSAALWYIDFLAKKKLITKEFADQTYVNNMVWAFGHISRGMYTSSKKPKHYSQLSAIQVGYLLDAGALSFEADVQAANGKDKGAFTVHFDKIGPAVEQMMKDVGTIKGKGDKKRALELLKKYVDSDRVPQKIIAERFLRHSKANFVYALQY